MSKLVSYDSGDDSANDGGSAGKDSSSTHETVKHKSLTKEKQLSSEWDSFNQMISDNNNEECKPVVKPEEATGLVMYPSYNASIIEFSKMKMKYDTPKDVKSSSDEAATSKEVHSRRFTENTDDKKSVGMYDPLNNSSEDEKSEDNVKASKPKETELPKEKVNTKKDEDSKSLKLVQGRKRVPRRSTSDDSSDESINDRKRKRSRSPSVSKKRKRSKVRERSKEKDSRHRGSRRHRSRSRSSSRNRHRHHTSKSHRERRSRSRSRRRDRRRHERRRSRSRSRQPRGPTLATLSKSAPVPSKSNPKNFKEQLKAMFIQAQSQSTEEIEKEIELDETRLLTANEKKSALPLNSKNPLAAMVAGGSKATPQQALAQTMAAMHAKVQEITGVAVPKYYNPAAVNPIKYAEQLKKRKLLWSKNKEADKEKEVDAKSQVQWSSTSFSSDQDGKMAAKFRKLMGIKEDERLAAISNDPDLSKMTEEQRKKQEELFLQLDREYEFARMSTHTCRGVGLGFTSHNVMDS